jgi:hypothetical protein
VFQGRVSRLGRTAKALKNVHQVPHSKSAT